VYSTIKSRSKSKDDNILAHSVAPCAPAQDSTITRRPKQDTDDGIQFFHVVKEDLDFLDILGIRQVKYRETCLWKWDAGCALENETKKSVIA
jgi:hypothetical protein